MRSFRSLSVLIVLLGGLLAYLYFVDAKTPVEQAEEKAKPDREPAGKPSKR